jgi:hypothetical protein
VRGAEVPQVFGRGGSAFAECVDVIALEEGARVALLKARPGATWCDGEVSKAARVEREVNARGKPSTTK